MFILKYRNEYPVFYIREYTTLLCLFRFNQEFFVPTEKAAIFQR